MPDDKADNVEPPISVQGDGVCPVGQEPPLEQPREIREEVREERRNAGLSCQCPDHCATKSNATLAKELSWGAPTLVRSSKLLFMDARLA